MRDGSGRDIVRDLLWKNIPLEPAAARIVDTPAFQRLRYVRQLGHAFLVYPGATHSRFEHTLGAYHLARRALDGLAERGDLEGFGPDDTLLIRLAALLHDIGHYPFSHALEEEGSTSHEALADVHLRRAPLADALAATGLAAPVERLGELIRGTSTHSLAGLVSGSLDLDKIDYLKRDALMCGVPYGEIDVDRLLACLTVVDEGGRRSVGILEKGLSALESLLFAKYQMYRNVYWHHAVRSATAMFKRLVREAAAAGALDAGRLPDATDDALIHDLMAMDRTGLAAALRERRLHKRALEIATGDLQAPVPSWVWRTRRGSPAPRTRSPCGSASSPASCSWTTRTRPRCSASTSPSSGARGAWTASAAAAGRAGWTCPASPTTSPRARGGCGCSSPAR